MNRKTILSIIIGQELGLILVSFIWLIFKRLNHINNWGILSLFELTPFKGFSISGMNILYGFIASILLVALSFLVSFTYEPFKKSLELIDELVLHMLKPSDILPIALLSGIGEELFFRGILQHSLGIYTSNIIFALLHFPGKDYWVYSLWTLFAGLFLGNIYSYTHNLFLVMLIHVLNNLFALLIWQKFKHKIIKEKENV